MLKSFQSRTLVRPDSVREGLKLVAARLLIDTELGNIVRTFDPQTIDHQYIGRYNLGDSIYSQGSPYASFVNSSSLGAWGNKYSLLQRSEKKWLDVDVWPKDIGQGEYYLRDNGTNRLTSVADNYGIGARTFIEQDTIEKWIAFWSVVDLIEGIGSYSYNNDDRIPERDKFLFPYNETLYPYHFGEDMTKDERRFEIKATQARTFGLTRSLEKTISEWISEDPFTVHSVRFDGRNLIIDRHADFTTLAYFAEKENNPFLQKMLDANLL